MVGCVGAIVRSPEVAIFIKIDGFVQRLMDVVSKIMDFVFKMMNSVLNIMDFAFKRSWRTSSLKGNCLILKWGHFFH